MALTNPFFFRELTEDSPFCDRQKELKDLIGYAEGRANVVLFSPRRYGKTSLVRRVQKRLVQRGFLPVFVDFFAVSSVDEAASRLAKAVFRVTRQRKPLWQRAVEAIKSFRPVLRPDQESGFSLSVELAASRTDGMEILEETLSSIAEFQRKAGQKLHVVFDEFQEIIELRESHRIEGVMRSHIQRHPFPYFFVGSRRRILLAMFNEKKRPFFQSAVNYALPALPHDELAAFIVMMFGKGGKSCSAEAAERISRAVSQHPYYAQKLCFFIFEISGGKVGNQDIAAAFGGLVEAERPVFEAVLQGLAPQQIALLRAIANDPSPSVFSLDYLKRHGLGSTGGTQGGLKRLTALDLIEKDAGGDWRAVDPVFGIWLRGMTPGSVMPVWPPSGKRKPFSSGQGEPAAGAATRSAATPA